MKIIDSDKRTHTHTLVQNFIWTARNGMDSWRNKQNEKWNRIKAHETHVQMGYMNTWLLQLPMACHKLVYFCICLVCAPWMEDAKCTRHRYHLSEFQNFPKRDIYTWKSHIRNAAANRNRNRRLHVENCRFHFVARNHCHRRRHAMYNTHASARGWLWASVIFLVANFIIKWMSPC